MPADRWDDIGIELEVNDDQLVQMRRDYSGDNRCCLKEMLRIWLKQVDPPPSWSDIVDALDNLGNKELATKLRSKYCK